MRIVVTGAAGFVGSSLSQVLLADGHDLVGVDCFRPHYDVDRRAANIRDLDRDPRFDFHDLDILEADLAAILGGVDAVFHLAGRPGVRDSWGTTFKDYVDDNVRATQQLLEQMVAVGVPRIIFASSSSVYGELGDRECARETDRCSPLSPYGVTKLAAENLVMAYQDNMGLEAVALRYFSVYGPRQRPDMAIQKFIESGLRGEKIQVYGDGSQRRDVTYIDDCVEASLAGLHLDPGVYNVAGGSIVTLNHVLDVIDAAMGKPLRRTYVERQRGDVTATIADTSRLRNAGIEPKVPLEDGISRQVAYTTKAFAGTHHPNL